MKVLVINCGSSSIKYKLYFMDKGSAAASGLIERIGQRESAVHHQAQTPDGEKSLALTRAVPDHKTGLSVIMELLTSSETGVIADPAEVSAVGHRVVHGGERFKQPAVVTPEVADGIKAAIPLAPLHNPANLTGIEAAAALFPGAVQVAVFDTSFHQTMPQKAFMYAMPYELYEKLGVRRYGFHGISHHFVSRAAAKFLGKPVEEMNMVTLHLGGGGSACAIASGKSVDTSMGMTPLSGTIMGTRCGDIDPEIEVYLEHHGYSVEEVDEILNKKSGLLGICGSIDMRDIHERRAKGDARAELAFRMYAHSVRKYVGAYYAELGRLDAVVFTAGIGEHDAPTRQAVCQGLEALGIVFDDAANAAKAEGIRPISAPQSRVTVLVVPTDEEYEIARQSVELLGKSGKAS